MATIRTNMRKKINKIKDKIDQRTYERGVKTKQRKLNKDVKNNNGIITPGTFAELGQVPQKIVNQRASKGFSLEGFTAEQIAAIPQEIVNQCAKDFKMDALVCFTKKQIAAIPIEIASEIVKRSVRLYLEHPDDRYFDQNIRSFVERAFTNKQKLGVPQEWINEQLSLLDPRVLDLRCLTKEQIAAIPQETINQFVKKFGLNGFEAFGGLPEQRKAIPQEIINHSFAHFGPWAFLPEERESVPQKFKNAYYSDPELWWDFNVWSASKIDKWWKDRLSP